MGLAMTASAKAHTSAELDEWMIEWQERYAYNPSWELTVQLYDIARRHPCYFYDDCPPPPPHTHTRSSSTGSTTNTGAVANTEGWRGLVAAHFPANAVDNMLCIMWYESQGNPTADNPRSTARGLFQVLRSWPLKFGYSYADLYDPTINTIVARKVWDLQGYGAWTVWFQCR